MPRKLLLIGDNSPYSEHYDEQGNTDIDVEVGEENEIDADLDEYEVIGAFGIPDAYHEELNDIEQPLATNTDLDQGYTVEMEDIVTEYINDELEKAEAHYEAKKFAATIEGLETMVIVAHDNPDPDAVGSAMAIRYIGEELGVESNIIYGGSRPSRAENKALMNSLGPEMEQITIEKDTGKLYIDGKEFTMLRMI